MAPCHSPRLMAVLAMLAFGQGSAIASEHGLTLKSAQEIALARSPIALGTRAEIDVARAQVLASGAWPNPEFALEAGAQEQKVTLDQPIFLGAQFGLLREIAEGQILRAEAEGHSARRELARLVAHLYWTAQFAQTRLKLEHERLDLARDLQRVALRRLEEKDVSKLEALPASIAVSEAETELEQFEIEASLAKRRLGLALGNADVTSWQLESPLVAISSASIGDLAISDRQPRLEAMKQELNTARLQERAAGAAVWGEVRAGVHVIRDSSGVFPGAVLRLPLPLFNRQEAKVSAARSTIALVEARRLATRLELESQAADAGSRLSIASRRLGALERGRLAQTRLVLDLARLAYVEGEAGILTVLEAQRSWLEARESRLRALADQNLAIADLDALASQDE